MTTLDWLVSAGALGALFWLIFSRPDGGSEPEQPAQPPKNTPDLPPPSRPNDGAVQGGGPYGAIYHKYGRMFGLDPRLLRAIAMVESSERVDAFNPNDPSYGLMQILCTFGPTGRATFCQNRLPAVKDWPPKRDDLLIADTNVYFGAQILSWNIRNYGRLKGIALYNNWSGNVDRPRTGPFANQAYVDKVMGKYTELLSTMEGL